MELRDHKCNIYIWKEIILKIRGTKLRQNGDFSNLVIQVIRENGAFSEVD